MVPVFYCFYKTLLELFLVSRVKKPPLLPPIYLHHVTLLVSFFKRNRLFYWDERLLLLMYCTLSFPYPLSPCPECLSESQLNSLTKS